MKHLAAKDIYVATYGFDHPNMLGKLGERRTDITQTTHSMWRLVSYSRDALALSVLFVQPDCRAKPIYHCWRHSPH